MKKYSVLLLIFELLLFSKNEANKKEDQNFDLKELKRYPRITLPQAGAVDIGNTIDLNPEGLFWFKVIDNFFCHR